MNTKQRKVLLFTLAAIAGVGAFTATLFITFQPSLVERFAAAWVYEGEVKADEFTTFYMEALKKGAEEIEITPHTDDLLTFYAEFPRGTEFHYGEQHAVGIEAWYGLASAAAAALPILIIGILTAWASRILGREREQTDD